MSDIFSLNTVQITPELGMALKNFRIEHETTATSIIEEFPNPLVTLLNWKKGILKKLMESFL